MGRNRFLIAMLCAPVLGTLALVSLGYSDEWRPRHALVPPTGVMNLGEPASPQDVFLTGPASSAEQAVWLAGIQAWRTERLTRLRYNGAQYDRPELLWTRGIVSQYQLLVWERNFYDPETRSYTVSRLLDNIAARIGPIDAVLIWHVYPNIGADYRNQFDLLRDLPGGIAGVRAMVDEFHRRGVKVFFPTLAWDNGTHDEGASVPAALAGLLKEIGADGINFDTLESVPAAFAEASKAAEHPMAFEPQFDIRDESLAWTQLGWDDWVTWEDITYPFVPMVNQAKWLEPRHMVNVTDRFTRDKINSLQHAFFNGNGYATLENLWGFWYGMTPHDAETVLRLTRIERTFPELLVSRDWEPHAMTLQSGVFASRFPSTRQTLWTIVNRNEYEVIGEQLRTPYHVEAHYFDLWHGVELTPRRDGAEATLSFPIEGLGFGAVLENDEPFGSGLLSQLLQFMSHRSDRQLGSYSRQWSFARQEMVPIAATKVVESAPVGMIRIPSGTYNFEVRGIEIEGGNDPGVDVQYPWEDSPRRFHHHRLEIRSFYIDRTPVTNSEFKRFLDATGYRPMDDHNFLREWKNGTYPEGWGSKPVTWVSIEDARAFAAWAGKRLPNDWEWQYAAQGNDDRLYPWGKNWNPEALPLPDHGRSMRPPTDVDAFGQGASPFGVLDLEGNVSQWTNEFRDEHTRAAIIRGGAYYQPRGSIWYFPQTYRLDEHQKYLLMSPGRDRAGTIGFRCVVDSK